MPVLKNVSPLGDLEVFGRLVEAGAEFEVTDDQAASLLDQPDVWVAAGKPSKSPAPADKNGDQ